jgi:hypothetical protein
MDYFSDPTFVAVFSVVLVARFVVPFTVFRWPLPGIVACLVIDAVDQTVFQSFGYDPPFYQGYDKAMDVFYLGIAYIATLRNWASVPAFDVSRFLFFYRQVGAVAFELSGARWLLVVFPNTFEYFFIAVEAVRTRWRTTRLGWRGWIAVAACIWIFVKLPQEWWIHIAKLDFTDALADNAWFGPVVLGGLAVLLLVFALVVRPRLPKPDHRDWQVTAPPLPEALDTSAKRAAYMVEHGRVWSQASLEKSLLIGLLFVIYATILPGNETAPLRLLLWVGVFVLVNIAGALALARRGYSNSGLALGLVARFAFNLVLLGLVERVFYNGLEFGHGTFFVLLFSVIVTVYDRYRPVHEYRRSNAVGEASA